MKLSEILVFLVFYLTDLNFALVSEKEHAILVHVEVVHSTMTSVCYSTFLCKYSSH